MQILKRGLALILVLCLCVSTMGLTAFADDGEGDAEPATETTTTESVVRPDDVTEVKSEEVAGKLPDVSGVSIEEPAGLTNPVQVEDGNGSTIDVTYSEANLFTLYTEKLGDEEQSSTLTGNPNQSAEMSLADVKWYEEYQEPSNEPVLKVFKQEATGSGTLDGVDYDHVQLTHDGSRVSITFTNDDNNNTASVKMEQTHAQQSKTESSNTFSSNLTIHTENDDATKTADKNITDTWTQSTRYVTVGQAGGGSTGGHEEEAHPGTHIIGYSEPKSYERTYSYEAYESAQNADGSTTDHSEWTGLTLTVDNDLQRFFDGVDLPVEEAMKAPAMEAKEAAEAPVMEMEKAAEEKAAVPVAEKKAVREEDVAKEEAEEKVAESFPPAPPAEESGNEQAAATGDSLESRDVIDFRWVDGNQTVTFDPNEQTIDGIGTVVDVRTVSGTEESFTITGTISENADETSTYWEGAQRKRFEPREGVPQPDWQDLRSTPDVDFFDPDEDSVGDMRFSVFSGEEDTTVTRSALWGDLTPEQKAQLDQLVEEAKANLGDYEYLNVYRAPNGIGFVIVKQYEEVSNSRQAGTVTHSNSITITAGPIAEGRQEVVNKDQLVADIFGTINDAYVPDIKQGGKVDPASFSASWEAPVIPLPDGVASLDELEFGTEYPAADGKTVVVTQDTDEYGMPKYVVTTRLDGGDGSFDEVVEEYTGDYYISATRSVTAKTETQYTARAKEVNQTMGGKVASNTDITVTFGAWQDSEGNPFDEYATEITPRVVVISDLAFTLNESCLTEDGRINLNGLSLSLNGAVSHTDDKMKLHVYDDTAGEQVFDLDYINGTFFEIKGDSTLNVGNGSAIKMMVEAVAAEDIDEPVWPDPFDPVKPPKKMAALKADGAAADNSPSYWQTLTVSVTQGDLKVSDPSMLPFGPMPGGFADSIRFTEVKEETSSETLEIKMGAAPAGSGKLFAARTAASNPSKTSWSSLTFSSVSPEDPPTTPDNPPTPPDNPPTPPTPPVDPPTPPVDPPEDPELEEGEEIIEDEEVPLAAPPQTGDSRITYVWVLMMGAAALYLFFDQSSKRRSES